MPFRMEKTGLEDVILVIPRSFGDERGYFMEIYRQDLFKELGLPETFAQVNQSGSIKNTIRGLHFQWDPPQGKLMRVASGRAFLAAVDIRRESPGLGRWFGLEVAAEDHKMVWAPAGFARGFCVLSDFAEIQYFTTGVYNPKTESGLLWNDPDIGLPWPVKEPILSPKDRNAQTLKEWLNRKESAYFTYGRP
ncbi:MAG: dTDP-4-dehydrorhamnose 3,5-epimerase [Thermodesulfobacteriota bacterium]